MLIFLWCLAGIVGTTYFAYHLMWRGEPSVEVTIQSVILMIIGIVFGPITLFGALLVLLAEFLNSEIYKRLFDYKLFTIRKKK